jgi:hypothetical protein
VVKGDENALISYEFGKRVLAHKVISLELFFVCAIELKIVPVLPHLRDVCDGSLED